MKFEAVIEAMQALARSGITVEEFMDWVTRAFGPNSEKITWKPTDSVLTDPRALALVKWLRLTVADLRGDPNPEPLGIALDLSQADAALEPWREVVT